MLEDAVASVIDGLSKVAGWGVKETGDVEEVLQEWAKAVVGGFEGEPQQQVQQPTEEAGPCRLRCEVAVLSSTRQRCAETEHLHDLPDVTADSVPALPAKPADAPACVATAALAYLRRSYNSHTRSFTHDTSAFLRHAEAVVAAAEPILHKQPLYQKVAAPCYAFGDIHGNYRDLSYFLEELRCFGEELPPGGASVVFLGDYVDRGAWSLECVVHLLALKVLYPERVVLLRGNHEDPLVNGDTGRYGEASFLSQAAGRFGMEDGTRVWRNVNKMAFAALPLAASIAGSVFCAHGGIPRYSAAAGGPDMRLHTLQDPAFPRLETFSAFAAGNADYWEQFAADLCWSDPHTGRPDAGYEGFTCNRRGAGVLTYGTEAVATFLRNTGFEFVFRAHQERAAGIGLSQSARVVTIFSSSDYSGRGNDAGVAFVSASKEIQLIKKKAG